MHILITNDDGVSDLGLLAMYEVAAEFGTVSVLAPNKNWSGCGHVKTLDRPLRVFESSLADGTPALSSDGAPSDCVALAVLGVIEQKPDLVLSGINTSANLGDDVTYSGTVMAAMEGMIQGIPSIAFSQEHPINRTQDFSVTQTVARHVLTQFQKDSIPAGTFVSVNVPGIAPDQLKGIKMTRLGKRIYLDRLDKQTDPRGGTYYWIGGEFPQGEYEPDTDIGALMDGYASITPLSRDMTANTAFNWGKTD
ncbi:MAG: 5'/3'-nucleotidase SurE [Chloroflexota bacterium]